MSGNFREDWIGVEVNRDWTLPSMHTRYMFGMRDSNLFGIVFAQLYLQLLGYRFPTSRAELV